MALLIEQEFVDLALSYIGCPYIWQGKGKYRWTMKGLVEHNIPSLDDFSKCLDVFDCSGLVTHCLYWATKKKIDLRGTHSAETILQTFPATVNSEDGVILCYTGHVSIDLGRGRVVDAHGGDHTTLTVLDALQRNAKVEAHRINRRESTLLGKVRIPLDMSELKKYK